MIGRFLRDEDGADLVEYSILIVLAAAVAVGVLTYMGGSLSSIFSKIGAKVSTTGESIP